MKRVTIYFYRYDDETNCNTAESMIIYHWTPSSSLSSFRISDGKDRIYLFSNLIKQTNRSWFSIG